MSAPAMFALGASRPFGAAVAAALGLALEPHEEREFGDGEHKARSLADVDGRDAYVVHTLHEGDGQGPNDRLVRLLFFIGSLRDAGAASVTALVPYLAYARKDRRSQPRDPVTTRYVARLFEAVGATRVVTADVHNLAAFENAFRIRADNLEAAPVLAARVAAGLGGHEACVVSPDAGGMRRAERLREALQGVLGRAVGSASVEKSRRGGAVSGGRVAGDVAGRVAILVDDIIASGGTLAQAAQACRREGARRVIAAATHGLFSGDAGAVLAGSPIEAIVVTDTVSRELRGAPAIAVQRASMAEAFAAAVARRG